MPLPSASDSAEQKGATAVLWSNALRFRCRLNPKRPRARTYTHSRPPRNVYKEVRQGAPPPPCKRYASTQIQPFQRVCTRPRSLLVEECLYPLDNYALSSTPASRKRAGSSFVRRRICNGM